VYSRRPAGDPNGAARRFGVSGKLWHGVLVMFDRETNSLWSQLDGRAVVGPETGQYLQHVDSTYTTWEAWRTEHPQTLVLEKPADQREREGSHYAAYLEDPERLWAEHLADGLGGVGPKDVVYGIALNGEALAVSERLLRSRRVVNAVVGGRTVAWLLDEETGFPRAVERRLEGRVLMLEPLQGENPALLFRDASSGEVHGSDELSALRVDRAFWYAWRRTHPGSAVLTD